MRGVRRGCAGVKGNEEKEGGIEKVPPSDDDPPLQSQLAASCGVLKRACVGEGERDGERE